MAQPQSFDPTEPALDPAGVLAPRLVTTPTPADPLTTLYTTHYGAVVRLAAALGAAPVDAPAWADSAFADFARGRSRRRGGGVS
ncbi:MAG: hypothetical protein ACHQNA_14555, partial [Acidimicrobiales bacterium]